MAGADIDYLLTNINKVNWLKGILVMEITDEAVRPFVEQEIKMFHNDIKSNFGHRSLCGNCMSTNAKHCPSGKCSYITSTIESAHRFKGPCYKNSDITKWLSDPWEIAKCYMSRSRDLEGKPCSEIDFPSILNVVINNTRFEKLITAVDMTNGSSIFYRGRDVRNEAMHSRSYITTEPKLNRHCDIFIEIVNLICRDSQRCVEKIEQVRDTPLSITPEDIVKLKEQAARYQGLTDAVIEEMKKDLWDEAERMLMYIKDETKKAIGTSFIPNFVAGCKESFYRLIVEHVQRLKPERIKSDYWTVETFTNNLELLEQVKDLSKRHKEMLFPSSGSPVDITQWDIYLCCFVLNIKLHKPLEHRAILFIKNTKVLRDKLLDDPSGVDKSELTNLLDCFDTPMKDDIFRLFQMEHSVTDMFHANNTLQSWRRDDEKEGETRYRNYQVETDAYLYQMIKDVEAQLSMVKAQKPNNLQPRLSRVEKLLPTESIDLVEMTEGANEKYETLIEVQPCKVSKDKIDRLQQTMTSFEQNNHVLENTGAREFFENLTDGCAIKDIAKGSIIFKVVCPSIESLFGFWKGCTDGSVVKAMSRIRDAYRKHLGCNTLEFDIVLKKKEVTRCKIEIIEDLNSRMKRLAEQVTGVNDLIRKPVEDLNSRFERLEQQVTVVNYRNSQQDVERAPDSEKDGGSKHTYEHDGYDLKSTCDSEGDTHCLQQNERYMDDCESSSNSQGDTDSSQGDTDSLRGDTDSSQGDTDCEQQHESYMYDFESMFDSQGDTDSKHHNEQYRDDYSRLRRERTGLRERRLIVGTDNLGVGSPPNMLIDEPTKHGRTGKIYTAILDYLKGLRGRERSVCTRYQISNGPPFIVIRSLEYMFRGMQQTANVMGTHAMQGVASVFRCTKSLKKTIFGQNAVTATDVMAEDTDIDETKHKAYLIGENALCMFKKPSNQI